MDHCTTGLVTVRLSCSTQSWITEAPQLHYTLFKFQNAWTTASNMNKKA